MTRIYPWSAVVGQDRLRLALTLCAIDPAIGGVLIHGPRGMAKTTLARALGELVPGRFVNLPLGASEERITGSLDLGAALSERRVAFQAGLLARAHEGVLYVDEVNLLADHLVDLLLDAAATGVNVVERDGVSHSHPARFVLIGSMNPEEGELRPQLLDRFGLSVTADAQLSTKERTDIVARRLSFESNPERFRAEYEPQQQAWQERCATARARLEHMPFDPESLEQIAERCCAARVDGVRADLAMVRAARAHAAWQGRARAEISDIDAVAEFALSHRRPGPTPAGGSPPPASTPPMSSASGTASGASEVGSGSRMAPSLDSRAEPEVEAGSSQRSDGRQTANTDDGRDTHSGHQRGPSAQPVAARPWLARRSGLQLDTDWDRSLDGRRRAQRAKTAATGWVSRRSNSPDREYQGSIDWFGTLSTCPDPAPKDVRFRSRHAPPKQLIMIGIDCSASMLRGGSLARAKGLAERLECEARRAGAHTALLTFQGTSARIVVAPTAARGQLQRNLDTLGAGGGTPLRQAVLAATRLAESRSWRRPSTCKRLVLFTDGRTRESVADLRSQLRALEVEVTLVDCEHGFVRLGRTLRLARELDASHTSIQQLEASAAR